MSQLEILMKHAMLLFLIGSITILTPSAVTATGHPTLVEVNQQCDLSAELPLDEHRCQPGMFDLCANVTAPTSQFEIMWLANGEQTNYDLCEEVLVEESTEFTLIATYTDENNLIENGDFENGDNGSFDTEYEVGMGNCFHSAGFLTCEGFYQVMDNPQDGLSAFSPCSDNTPGGDLMMVVNGSINLAEVWCQEVCLDQEADYIFTFFGASVHPDSPAELQVAIDGDLIGDIFEFTNNTCEWEEFTTEFFADGASQVEICITNQNTEMQGNDFALDDISLVQVCSIEESVMVSVSEIDLNILPPPSFSCQTTSVPVEVVVNSAIDIDEVIWSTNDGIILGDDDEETILAGASGIYVVTVTDDQGCNNSAATAVMGSADLPAISITGDTLITCANTNVTLTGVSNLLSNTFVWTDSLGTIVSTTAMLTTTQSGIFQLQVSNAANTCSSIDSVEITVDTTLVDIDLLKTNDLTCNLLSSTLSTSVAQDSVIWSNNLGAIIPSTNDTITITEAAEYYAEIIGTNGCVQIDTILVAEINPNFQFAVTADNHIDCINLRADVQIDFDENLYDFNWIGTAASLGTENEVQITEGGTYNFLLTDNNGCMMEDSVIVTEDFFIPEIFTTADTITCSDETAQIEITWLENIDYIDIVTWFLPDGSIQPDDTTIETDQNGWVIFDAVIKTNGCTTTDSVFVEVSNDLPSVMIVGDTLTCDQPSVTLSANVSNDVTSFVWQLADGTTSNETTIQGDQLGTYSLRVSNSSGCSISDQFVLTSDTEGPMIELGTIPTLTCLTTSIKPNVTVTGEFLEFLLTGPGTSSDSPDIDLTTPGRYDIVVTDENGCSDTASFTIATDTRPTTGWELFTETTLSCNAPTIFPTVITDVIENRTTAWLDSNGDTITTGSIVITEPGTYTLSIANENGCPALETFVVELEDQLPEFELSTMPVTCITDSVTIRIDTDNNLLNFILRDPITNDTLGRGDLIQAPIREGLQVIATDDFGCSSRKFVELNYDTLAPQFTVSALDLGCNTDGVPLVIESTFILNDIQIFDSQGDILGDENYKIINPGDYTVEATSANGCSTAELLMVRMDNSTVQFSLETELIACNNLSTEIRIVTTEDFDEATLTDANGMVVATILTGETVFNDITVAGTYKVEVIASSNLCTSSETIVVAEDNARVSFSASAAPLSCNVSTTRIDLTTSESFSEVFGVLVSTQEVISDILDQDLTVPGIYEIHLIAINGCETVELLEIMAMDELPALDLFEATTTDCDGNGQIDLLEISGGMEPYSVSLDGVLISDFTDLIPVTGSGMHNLLIVDANGCNLTHMFDLTPVPELEGTTSPLVEITDDNSRALSVILNKPLEEIAEIIWTPASDLSCNDCLNPIFQGSETSSYSVLIRDNLGCEIELDVELQVSIDIEEEPEPRIYLPNIISAENSTGDNRFTVFSSEEGIAVISELNIYDRWGNLVFANANFQPNDQSQGWNGRIDNEAVIPGVYIYYTTITYDDGETEIFSGDLTVIR